MDFTLQERHMSDKRHQIALGLHATALAAANRDEGVGYDAGSVTRNLVDVLRLVRHDVQAP